MKNLLKNLVMSAFLMAPFALTGCTPECVDRADCAEKAAEENREYTCVEGTCTVGSPFPDAGTGGGSGGGTGGGDTGGGMGGGTGGGGGDDAGTDDAGMDDAGMDDAGMDDAGMDDAGMDDAGMDDAGMDDAGMDAGMDAGTDDAGMDAGTDDAGMDAGTEDAGMDAGPDVDLQIAAVRTAAETITDGGVVGLPINGALVTYLKPLAQDAGAGDPAGFFIQASQSGPALFVAIDPATITGGPFVPGDLVEFTVQTVARSSATGNLRTVVAVTGATKSSSGNPVSGIISAIDAVNFPDAGVLDAWESKLISVTATVTADPATSGAGYKSVLISTPGTPSAGNNFRLRLPAALMDTMIFGPGCTFSLNGAPLWRSFNAAQPSAWLQSELTNVTCPAPVSLSAFATSNTSVTVLFSRDLNTTTVTPGAFTISGPLAVTAATPINPRAVALTTAAQTDATTYTVIVDNTVTDTRGSSLPTTGNTATFTGLADPVCNSGVVISAIYGGGGNSGATYTHDYVELKNRTAAAVSLDGWSLQYASSTGSSFNTIVPLTGTIPANGYFLVRLASQNVAVGAALPTTHDLDFPGLNMGGTNGVLALVASTATAAVCPAVGTVADLVGYGTSAACREGTPTANVSATNAAFRAGAGCTDTNVNSADFAVAAVTSQAPRNSVSTAVVCTCP